MDDHSSSYAVERNIEEAATSGANDQDRRDAASSDDSTRGIVDTELSSMQNDNQDHKRRMDQMESTLHQLLRTLGSYQPHGQINYPPREAEDTWNTSHATAGPSTGTSNFRWETIQPFPDDVPANRMWEQWNRFIDRFEIAASLSNINDPVKRAQILFLSLGEKMQGIVRAARLRPSLQESNCYSLFVKNIEAYLRSMVDVTAEHEAFTNMKQEPKESTIAFHARLMEKVRLCGYSSGDLDRFVRAQLLKGMHNKELVKAARTFGYETLFIVQSATREEAYTAETIQTDPPQALAVVRNYQQTRSESQQWKPKREAVADKWTHSKKRERDEGKSRGLGRRSRCSKCNRLYHKFGSCPALNSNCNTCGVRGHFAVVCRKSYANHLKFEGQQSSDWSGNEHDKEVNIRADDN